MNNIASPQGHYARIRQRFLSAGIDGFLDYEVVELLLNLRITAGIRKLPPI
jgi:DNA repair protein RadC